jgi:hypothetical protein
VAHREAHPAALARFAKAAAVGGRLENQRRNWMSAALPIDRHEC